MRKTFNCLTDYTLAHDADQKEIDATFKECPWMKRLDVNGVTITREEWRQDFEKRKAAKNGN